MVPDSPLDQQDIDALEAWAFLSNGLGGIDWAGLPWVIALLDIADVDGLAARLLTIKHHRVPNDGI